MRCADCRFWKREDEGREETGDPPMGACHRHAPRPTFEDALSVAALLVKDGTLAISEANPRDDYGHVEPWYQRTTAWPVTPGTDFCGEFVTRQERQGFV